MGSAVQPAGWTIQPRFALLNRGHPLARYVKQYYLGGSLGDGAQSYTLNASGSATTGASVAGQAFAPTGSGAYFSTSISTAEVNAGHPWSYLAYVSFSSITASAIALIGTAPNPASYDRSLHINSSHFLGADVYDGSNKDATASGVTLAANTPYAVAVSATSSLLAIYVNGVLAGSVAVTKSGYTGYGSTVLLLGYGSSVSPTASSVAQIGMFARLDGYAITAADAADHAANPWYLQAPRQRRLYFGAAAASSAFLPSPVVIQQSVNRASTF